MPISATCSTMGRNPPGCGIASTPSRWTWKKTKKASRYRQDAFFRLLVLRSIAKRELCRRAGTPRHGGYRVALALPDAEQQHFCACRILKHIVRARKAFHFIKARPARIWPRRRTHGEKLTQFSDLFLRMISQIFHEGRLFGDGNHHDVSPPHSAYVLLTSKDAENAKMFHGAQRFFETIWPAGSIIPMAVNTSFTKAATWIFRQARKQPPCVTVFPASSRFVFALFSAVIKRVLLSSLVLVRQSLPCDSDVR